MSIEADDPDDNLSVYSIGSSVGSNPNADFINAYDPKNPTVSIAVLENLVNGSNHQLLQTPIATPSSITYDDRFNGTPSPPPVPPLSKPPTPPLIQRRLTPTLATIIENTPPIAPIPVPVRVVSPPAFSLQTIDRAATAKWRQRLQVAVDAANSNWPMGSGLPDIKTLKVFEKLTTSFIDEEAWVYIPMSIFQGVLSVEALQRELQGPGYFMYKERKRQVNDRMASDVDRVVPDAIHTLPHVRAKLRLKRKRKQDTNTSFTAKIVEIDTNERRYTTSKKTYYCVLDINEEEDKD
jgi:hypothetical protein